VGVKPTWESEAELPPFRDRMQTGGDHVEVLRAVVSRARITLCSPGSLEVQAGVSVPVELSQDVLTFEGQIPAEEAYTEVWTITLEWLAGLDLREIPDLAEKVLFRYPSPDCYLQSVGILDQIKNLHLGQLEFLGQRVKARTLLESFLSQELTMPLVLACSIPFELDVREK